MAPVPAAIDNFNGNTGDHKLDRDHKREVDSRRKYALGVVGQDWPPEMGRYPGRVRPAAPITQKRKIAIARSVAESTYKGGRKYAGPSEMAEALSSDSSAAEDVPEPSAAPEPDADITYSFDAPRGPTPGGEILSMAINKAVERYETKEMEKLIKNEYDVVAKEEEDEQGGYTADDDFELV